MSNQRCAKCGGTLYSDPKYGCTSLSCSKVAPDFHFDLTKPTQSTDTACNVPVVTQLVVGNRDDGTRGWSGTIHRIVFVNSEIDATALNGLLA